MKSPTQPPRATDTLLTDADDSLDAGDSTLLRGRSFWGMTATQFLGAFNDNLFKQLVLLLAVGAPAGVAIAAAQHAPPAAARSGPDLQSLAMFLFASPFLLFSGFAGYLSERLSKRTVVVACKIAEIGIVLLGMAALMGTHSAFFGPPKWGILPELFAERDLPLANGIILMTTFLAIIFGTALAGVLVDLFGIQRLWLASIACIAIAMLGTLTAVQIRPLKPINPRLPFQWSALTVPADVVALLKRDHELFWAMCASCMFWLIGGIVQPSVNSVGKVQFGLLDGPTSALAACMGIGIAVGCVIAGKLSRNRVNFRLVKVGAWLIVVILAILAIPGSDRFNFIRVPGTVVALLSLGFSAGLFAVPIQVFLQTRPPESLKGRTIATTNLANWIAIITSAGIYFTFDFVVRQLEVPRATVFALTAVLMLPVAIFYRPTSVPPPHQP
jgi:acyl-[acyl-carrier-protein]-phospholipid O-acyltransferase/long-chain-fatty-acid--[acyl-carrier-protein] ligase